jgi:hypothetical protein
MTDDMMDKLQEEHLCTYFVLPLVHLSKFNFLENNFVNSYLHVDGLDTHIVVKVIMTELLSRQLFGAHPNYVCTMTDAETGGYSYLVYRVSRYWRGDLYYFRCGQYSMMSQEAKETIRIFSGLPSKVVTMEGTIETDVRLMALDRNPVLEEWWNERQGHTFRGELLPKPVKTMYIDITKLKEQS